MRDINEAIEVGCRAIETYLKDRGEQTSFHMNTVNLTRDEKHPPTDFAGHDHREFGGVTRMMVMLDGVHMGAMSQEKQDQRDALKAPPDVVADIPDAGYRAGARALLEKFQRGIANATEMAEGAQVPQHLRVLVTAAEAQREDDPVVKLLRAVLDLQDDRNAVENAREQLAKAVIEIKEADPEKQLHERLRLKMKAQYTGQRDVLIEFVNWVMVNRYNIKSVDAVDDFLEKAGGS